MRRRILADSFRRTARRYAVGIALLLLTNALVLSIPWLLKQAIEAISSGAGTRLVGFYAVAILVVATAQAVVRTGSRLLILGASRLIAYDLRRRLFEHLVRLPAPFYDRMRTGDLMSRAVNDMQLVRSFFGPGVLNFVNTTVAYAGSVSIMAWINPVLCAFSLIPYPLVLVFMNRLARALYRRSTAAQEQLAALSSRVQENLSGIQQVKAFVREEAETAEFAEAAAEYRRRNLALARVRGAIVPLMGSIGGLGTLAVLWLGGRHVVEGRMTLGDFVAFNSYLAALAWPTLAMGWILNVFQRGMGAMDRIGAILEEPAGEPGGDGFQSPDAPDAPGITARGLSFRYEGAVRPALEGIDLDVAAGSTLGIVGTVGSGKSTLLSLVAGLYPVPPNTLTFGGRDVTSIPSGDLRARIGLVPQESFLFSRSIAENISFGRPAASREEIARAGELSRLSEDLDDLPKGYDTLVGERGVTLSGGQRQRVALARALLLDPAVLILDDTLSAVDAATEAAILANLKEIMRRRTCLVASHRISAVQDAEQIIVLDEGRIVERGRHEDLLASGGLYARLYQKQQLEERLERA